MMAKAVSPWSVSVAVEDIPDAGLHIAIEAPAATRAALATFANVREVPRVSAVFDLTRRGAEVDVTGQVKALVGQTCVVSLEPMETEVDEAVDLTFAPGPAGVADMTESEAEGHRASLDEELPEPLIGGKLDLGAIATEFLILGIDPYPRRLEVEFAPPETDDAGMNPFAVLEALKKPPGGGQP
jgi:uncharacterized metal-binding protein YceD (DUF177 family)